MLALPADALPTENAPSSRAVGVVGQAQPARAAPLAAREVVAQQRLPLTVASEGPPELRTYAIQDGDTLLTIAEHYGVSAETVAYNNGITDPRTLKLGMELRIPPMNGAIYAVQQGDTVEGVAARFKVDPKSVMDTNRLHFEPQNFTAGKTILIPVTDSRFPDFQLKDLVPTRAEVVARGPAPAPPPAVSVGSKLGWPVRGVITQYFWYAHLGVDMAAPYGSGIAASDDGVVSADGWVPVGGLRVCVKHDWGMETCYYHTSATYVEVGQRVKRGQIIAAIGLTGVTTGPHVHWEARFNGKLVNPLQS